MCPLNQNLNQLCVLVLTFILCDRILKCERNATTTNMYITNITKNTMCSIDILNRVEFQKRSFLCIQSLNANSSTFYETVKGITTPREMPENWVPHD